MGSENHRHRRQRFPRRRSSFAFPACPAGCCCLTRYTGNVRANTNVIATPGEFVVGFNARAIPKLWRRGGFTSCALAEELSRPTNPGLPRLRDKLATIPRKSSPAGCYNIPLHFASVHASKRQL